MKRIPRYEAPPGALLGLKEAIRKRKCRFCRCDLPPKRRNAWCGEECVNRWKLFRGDPKSIREALNKRDQWMCGVCGMDIFILYRIIRRIKSDPTDFLVMMGWSHGKAVRRIYWEADHILPLVEGGTHDLSNIRTVCVPCHTTLTKDLASRRAMARKKKKP